MTIDTMKARIKNHLVLLILINRFNNSVILMLIGKQ